MRNKINYITQNQDERYILNNLLDKVDVCHEYNFIQTSFFLTEKERELVRNLFNDKKAPKYYFWGGYDNAVRNICIICPDYIKNIKEEIQKEDPLAYIRIVLPKNYELSHSDYLGALMALGIKRNLIGDIIVYEGGCDIICLKSIENFLLENFTRAGRVGFTTKSLQCYKKIKYPEISIKKETINLSSLHLDSYISHVYKCSRSKADEYITQGKVFVNGCEVIKPTKILKVDDNINLRSKGKSFIKEVVGVSKKNKLIVVIGRFV